MLLGPKYLLSSFYNGTWTLWVYTPQMPTEEHRNPALASSDCVRSAAVSEACAGDCFGA